MKKYLSYILLCLISTTLSPWLMGQTKTSGLSGEYLGQEKPGLKPKIFAPGIVSKEKEYDFGSVFSKDQNEFYYGVSIRGKNEIRYMLRNNNKWSKPAKINFNCEYGFNDPFLSPDGERLYYISDMPLNGKGDAKDIDIWYSQRTGDTWSAPINAGDVINSPKNEYYISFTNDGTMYFASNREATDSTHMNFDIYYSELKNGVYQCPVKLCNQINSSGYEADVFIAPDESYIIFCSTRKGGYGRGDLYISFKEDKKWTKAINMGDTINTEGFELCPFVTNDGKYLFYTSNQNIYWIDSKIIESLKRSSL